MKTIGKPGAASQQFNPSKFGYIRGTSSGTITTTNSLFTITRELRPSNFGRSSNFNIDGIFWEQFSLSITAESYVTFLDFHIDLGNPWVEYGQLNFPDPDEPNATESISLSNLIIPLSGGSNDIIRTSGTNGISRWRFEQVGGSLTGETVATFNHICWVKPV